MSNNGFSTRNIDDRNSESSKNNYTLQEIKKILNDKNNDRNYNKSTQDIVNKTAEYLYELQTNPTALTRLLIFLKPIYLNFLINLPNPTMLFDTISVINIAIHIGQYAVIDFGSENRIIYYIEQRNENYIISLILLLYNSLRIIPEIINIHSKRFSNPVIVNEGPFMEILESKLYIPIHSEILNMSYNYICFIIYSHYEAILNILLSRDILQLFNSYK